MDNIWTLQCGLSREDFQELKLHQGVVWSTWITAKQMIIREKMTFNIMVFLNWNQVLLFLLDFLIGLYFLITGTHVPGIKVSSLFRTRLVWFSEPFSNHVPGIYNLTFFSVFRTFQQPYLLQAGPTNASREMESVAIQPGTDSLNSFTIVVQHCALALGVMQVDRSR